MELSGPDAVQVTEATEVFVEFSSRPGAITPTAVIPERWADRSREALDCAVGTIRKVVEKAMEALKSTQRPSKMEVEFSLKFDAEVGAFLAKTSQEGALTVRLTWQTAGPTSAENN